MSLLSENKNDAMAEKVKSVSLAAIMVAAMQLAGCNMGPAPDSHNSDAAPTSTATVVLETPAAEPESPVVPMAPPTVLQSQPGPDGSQLDLLKVAVTGDILTVTLRCSSSEKYNSQAFSLKGISVVDDATAQRIAVLKDADANWLASNVSGDSIMADCGVKPGIVWAKFAAPSAGAKTVSINLPKVAPFDGVPVTH